MSAKTVLRWLLPKSDPPMVQRVVVETEEQLALRNQEKLEQAKRTLGVRYVLHQSNAVTRQHEERSRALATRARKSMQVNAKPPPSHARQLPRNANADRSGPLASSAEREPA